MILQCIVVLLLATSIASSGLAEDKSLKELLPRLKPLEPQDALKSFRIERGFRMELVAAEPDVVDPIALAFDEHRRMYVCEDRDYPFPAEEGQPPLGRVRLLEDEDRDGHYERSTVFAENVHWPSGAACWKGGVFIAAPPQILYLKDTNGDRKADVRQVVFEGFGTAAAEDIMNNLKWGLDNRIYGAASYNGGEVRREGDDRSKPISVRGASFRFDPVAFQLDQLPGTGDFGNCFDDWGNRFVSNAGQLLMHPVYGEPYLGRNPHLTVRDVLHRSASAKRDMFSISPPEPWRVVRKRFWERWVDTTRDMRASRFSDAELAERGFVTGAAGVAIYRGSKFPREYDGNSFTAEPAGNVVIRLRVQPSGVTFDAFPTSSEREFLASTDNWFRPVNVANGPDGCLYICDMYRELIEDPSAIPDDILKLMDVASGRDRGRIYRIVFDTERDSETPLLSDASTAQLVAALSDTNAWTRETAQRLLVERQDRSAVSALRTLLAHSEMPQARLHALWTNEALGGNDETTLLTALGDRHPAVREHAVRIAERRMNSLPTVCPKILEMAQDEAPRVRYQVAFTLGECADRNAAIDALATIAARDAKDPYFQAAVLSSVPAEADKLLAALAKQNVFARTENDALLGQLIGAIASRGDKAEIDGTIAFATSNQIPADSTRSILLSMAAGLARGGAALRTVIARQPHEVRNHIAAILDRARADASDDRIAGGDRLEAVQLLRYSDWTKVSEALASLLTAHEPATIQVAAVQSLSAFDNAEVASRLIDGWRGLSPAVRSEAAEALLSRPVRAAALLKAVRDGGIPAGDLDPARQEAFLNHRDAEIRALAAEVFGQISRPTRSKVVEAYRASLEQPGDAGRGAAVFQARCAACHARSNDGKQVGPDLATVQNRSPEQLLLQILDPNREVKPQYLNYQAMTDEGRILSGIIAAESESSLTLRRAEGAEDVIARQTLESFKSSGLSLMPEGLEQNINPQQMADLLRYLQTMK
ncbi:PVC-type heme-binding CxxCH protein [Lignipirellula cremea]|uniref:PVC-type heme-binding CxxCH protein n=1 Tax=Lignipirellula cremea TaxID=2528010 RepID=UPI0018D21837|nr:PVC-type heme-binding CxxCH protein [Lignipirellula cremea]